MLYKHIPSQRDASYSIEKFDREKPCDHEGLHYHNSYEIVFIKNGKGKIIVNNTFQEYQNGALLLLGPCLSHFSFSNYANEDNYEVVVHFDEFFVENRIKQIPEFQTLVPFIESSKKVLIFSPRLKDDLSDLFNNLNEVSSLEQLATIFNILCKMATDDKVQPLLNDDTEYRIDASRKVEKIFKFISDNYSKKISTQDIASYSNLTTNSFCKLFKRLTNKSFLTYLNEYRIHKAVNLLEETADSISEIAYRCGFENLSYFSKVFQRVKGISPKNYRKAYCQKWPQV